MCHTPSPTFISYILICVCVAFVLLLLLTSFSISFSLTPKSNHSSPSPYYNSTHHSWRLKLRAFVESELMPNVNKWDEAGDYPAELHRIAYDAGIYAAMWPAEFGGTPEAAAPPPAKVDIFHDLIMIDELSRTGCGGILWAVFYSFGIALPPILKVGLGDGVLRDRVCRDVITGKAIMSLAVTEPNAGSDVAQIQCTCAECPDDNEMYVVNGEKYEHTIFHCF